MGHMAKPNKSRALKRPSLSWLVSRTQMWSQNCLNVFDVYVGVYIHPSDQVTIVGWFEFVFHVHPLSPRISGT